MILKESMKGCLCYDGKHKKTWHCIIGKVKSKTVFRADFPFERPPTKDTGDWSLHNFHKIKKWGSLT